MPFRLCHASVNMFARTSQRLAVYAKAATLGDVLTFGEARKDHRAIKGLHTFDSVLYGELGIAFGRDKFTHVDHAGRVVMLGGKRGRLGSKNDKRRRGPNRPALVVVLRENATGIKWLIGTHHSIAKADTSKLWRRPLSEQALKGFGALIRDMHAKHPDAFIVATGDWNRKRPVSLGIGLTEIKTPATFGRLRYDRIHAEHDVRVTGVRAVDTASDHHALVANVSTVGHTTPPPPEVPVARQARSLDVLLAEVNQLAPNRSKASDGGLGDRAHASRTSDHNPNSAGVWRARDFTHDPKGGLDAAALAASVAAMLGKHPALGSGAYVIWNRRIISTNRLREGWRTYDGSNPHNKHCHVSVATAASGYDSTKPWGVGVEPEPAENNVQRGRALIREGLAEIRKAPETRKVVHARADQIEAILKKGPSK